MDIRFLNVAQYEFDDAIEYYNGQSPGLGDQFLLEATNGLQRIQSFPKAWHPYTSNTRRYLTRRFPYSIIYQLLESEILIVAVAHTSRRPGYWRDRITNR